MNTIFPSILKLLFLQRHKCNLLLLAKKFAGNICLILILNCKIFGITATDEMKDLKYNFLSGISEDSNSNDNISIKLSKRIYKKYEPISYTFSYFNSGSETDSIFIDMDAMEFTYFLLDENGNSYGDKFDKFIPSYGRGKPQFTVKSKDTLKLTYILNGSVGKELKEKYFYKKAYYEPGKYSISVKILINSQVLTSNVEQFEVEEISDFENQIVKLEKERKYDYLNENYPDNYFMEFILISRFQYLNYLKYSDENIDKEELSLAIWNTLIKLLQDFPDSYYFLGHNALGLLNYMTTYFGNYNSLQTFLRENYKDSNLCKSLDEDFVKGKMSIIYDENGELR